MYYISRKDAIHKFGDISESEAKQIVEFLKSKHLKLGLEIGSRFGYSSINLSLVTDKLICVDIYFPNEFFDNLKKFNIRNIETIQGDSTSDIIKSKLKKLAPFDFVFIDGNHQYNHVLSDLNLALDVTKENGYILMHDIKTEIGPTNLWNSIKHFKKISFDNTISADGRKKGNLGVIIKRFK